MQIEFWRTSHPKEKRTSDVVVRRWRPCRPMDGKAGAPPPAADSNEYGIDGGRPGAGVGVTGVASHLWPYSLIAAVVRVLNGAHRGPPSRPVVFNTSEGGRLFRFWLNYTEAVSSNSVLVAFHDADTDTDILAKIVARMSACRSACRRNNFRKSRVSDVSARILTRMSVSVSASWNSSL